MMKAPLLTLAYKLDHLPARKQRELARVVQIIFEEFEDAQKTKLSEKARAGRILKLILYGSYARGTWVEDRGTGYMSDYDLMVVVNTEAFAEENEVWRTIDERLLQSYGIPERLKAPVSIIAHSLADVNDKLARGLPFFIDIAHDGIMLYEAPGHPLAGPGPLTAEEKQAAAREYFQQWLPKAGRALETAAYQLQRSISDDHWKSEVAFTLHQATERAYHCVLLVFTLYSPKLHNIEKLRDFAEGLEPLLFEAWPRNTKFSRRCYSRLVRAYVDARYSPHYEITKEELEWLVQRVHVLQEIVEAVCREKLDAR